jgi:hypothetical protein
MKIIRVFLLVLIVIGLGLLITQRLWLPRVVAALMNNDVVYSVVQPQAVPATSTTSKSTIPSSPRPTPSPLPTDSGVDITVTIGPTCPVQHYPDTGACADKPYKTTLVLASTQIGKNGGVLITTDAEGHFSENLQPGTYTIRAQSDSVLPRLEPQRFTITAHTRTALTLVFDSGIR